MDEVNLGFGMDLTPLIEGIKTAKIGITELADTSKKATASVQQSFEVASKAVETFNAQLGSGEEIKNIAAPIKNLAAAYQQLKNLSGGTFDAAKLKQYQDALKNAGVQITALAGNYSKAFDPKKIQALGVQLQSATSDFKELKLVLDFIGKNIKDLNLNPEEAAKLTETITGLSSAFETVGNSAENFGAANESARAKLRKLKDEIAGLEVGSAEYEKLTAEAAKLRNEIEEVNKGVILQASHTTKLDAGLQVVEGLTAAFAVLQGTQALFGNSNEELQKSLLKVEAAMALLQGVQKIGQLLDKGSALNIFLLKTLRTQDAVATGEEVVANIALAESEVAAAAASKGLTAALLANPAGVVLVVVAALAAGLLYLAGAGERAREETIKLNEVQSIQLDTTQKLADKVSEEQQKNIEEAQRALVLAEKQGKSEAQIGILKLKVLDAQKDRLVALQPYAEDIIANGKSEFDLLKEQEKAVKDLARAQIDAVNSHRDSDKQRQTIAEGNLKNIETQLKAVHDFNKESEEVNAATSQQLAEISHKQYVESLKSATAIAEARVLIARKGSQQELEAKLNQIKTAAREELANVNLTEGERQLIQVKSLKESQAARRDFDIAQLENQKAAQESIIAVSTEGGKQEFDAKIKLIVLSAQEELKAEGLSVEKIKSIRLKAAREVANASKAFSIANNVSLLDAQLSAINAQLAVTKAGSEEEYNLKKDAVDKKIQLDLLGAQSSIKNEEERIAKQKEIIAKGNREKLDLDKQFLQAQSDQRVALALSESAKANAALQGDTGNLSLNAQQRFQAGQQQRQNELSDINFQLKEIEKLHTDGVINEAEYQTKKNNLEAAGVAKRAEIKNAEIANFQAFNIKDALLKSFGLSSDDPAVKAFSDTFIGAIKDAYSSVTGFLESQAQDQINAIQQVIDAIDKEITAQQTKVDKERALSDKGLANDLNNQEKLLQDLKDKKAAEILEHQKAQDKLRKIKQDELKIQAISAAATNIETGVTMLNAAAKIFKAHSGIPFVGVALSVGFAALLVSSFLALKSAFKPPEADIPTFRKGGPFSLMDALQGGPSHEQGGAGLYNEKTGEKLAEFEGNENLFIVNKGAASKWAGLLDAINRDRSPYELMKVIQAADTVQMPETKALVNMQRKVQDQKIFGSNNDNAELKRIADDVRELKEFQLNKEYTTETPNHTIIRKGNYTKMIRKVNAE